MGEIKICEKFINVTGRLPDGPYGVYRSCDLDQDEEDRDRIKFVYARAVMNESAPTHPQSPRYRVEINYSNFTEEQARGILAMIKMFVE